MAVYECDLAAFQHYRNYNVCSNHKNICSYFVTYSVKQNHVRTVLKSIHCFTITNVYENYTRIDKKPTSRCMRAEILQIILEVLSAVSSDRIQW